MPPSPVRRAILGTLLLTALHPLAAPAGTPASSSAKPAAARPPAAKSSTATPAAAARPSAARTLYTLSTRCSLAGGAAQPCTVEAVDEGINTLYRHHIGNDTITVRITERPVTMARYDTASRQWVPLRSAGALFSSNTVCFNGRELCVLNPNYLNSVRQDSGNLNLQGRDLVRVHFGADGRIDASCYDAGCRVEFQ